MALLPLADTNLEKGTTQSPPPSPAYLVKGTTQYVHFSLQP